MRYTYILIIIVIIFCITYHFISNKEELNINTSSSVDFMDETVLRIRCQLKEFDWLEPYLDKSVKETIGSGFFINDKGNIITNFHVIENAIKVFVQIPKYGNNTYECDVISIYPHMDIGLLKIKNYKNEKYFKLGDSDIIKKGNKSFAIGYPLGQNKYKITSGIISGYQDGDIQTDSPINPGNSGGPLVNEKMEVVGINYSGYSSAQNVGYAIPINFLKIILSDMYKKKIIYNPILGCSFNNTTDIILKYSNLCKSGYFISYIGKNSPMDNSNIKVGDILCSVDGLKIDNYGEIKTLKNNSFFHIFDYLNYKKVGDIVIFEVLTYDKNKYKLLEKKVKLGSNLYYKINNKYPRYENIDYQIIGGLVIMELSINHFNILKKNTNIIKYERVDKLIEPKLIITKVIKSSKLAEDNIFKGSCILEKVNNIKVTNLKELRNALLKVQENNTHKFISFLTETNKIIILDPKKIDEEEHLLSKKINYPLTKITLQLLDYYKNIYTTPGLTKEESSPLPEK